MSLRFHEIAETNHRILNPFTEEKLMLVGEICRLNAETQQLDLCCGKAEMLCRWSEKWGIGGTGVDISAVFVNAARERARELGIDVPGQVSITGFDDIELVGEAVGRAVKKSGTRTRTAACAVAAHIATTESRLSSSADG